MTHTWCERLDRVLIRHGGALIGDRSDLLRRARQPVEIASCGIVALQKLRCYNGIMTNESVRLLTNQQLLADVATVAGRERETTAQLIVLLSEIDSRRLYLGEGYSSLFTFCTQRLHLAEHAAYGRIEAARAARRFPVILELLTDGSITLTTVCLLASHLTAGNYREVLEQARHKSKREIEQLIAAMCPEPAVPSVIRKLPEPTAPASTELEPSAAVRPSAGVPVGNVTPHHVPAPLRPTPAILTPLAPERYKVQLTIDRATLEKLRRVQDLFRHVVPSGDPAMIFDRALTVLLRDLERRKLARVSRPRQSIPSVVRTRHVPAVVRRTVWERDGGRCAFIGTDGRCGERGFLEFHHVVPFADGGETTSDNLQLRCRSHNAHEAREYFGAPLVREQSVAYAARSGPS